MINDKNFLRILLFSLILFLITLNAMVLPIIVGPETRDLTATLVFFLSFILYWVTISYFLSWEGSGERIESLGFEWDNKSFSHITIGAIAGLLSAALVILFTLALGGDLRPPSEITEDLILSEIIITTPVAFFEELAYRGYLMTRMEKSFGKNYAIIASSIVFSLLHFSWWTKIAISDLYLIVIFSLNMFIGGVVLGYSYYLSGRKLWVPIAFHFSWNFMAYILFPEFPNVPVTNPALYQIEWGITTIFGFLFGLSILYMFLTTNKKKK